MGITIRQQQYQDTHTNYFQYIHLRNTTKTSAQRLFRYTARSASMAAPSVKQSEFLKNNPVPGITSWYETSVENNQIFTKRLHLQEIASGKLKSIHQRMEFKQSTNGVSVGSTECKYGAL